MRSLLCAFLFSCILSGSALGSLVPPRWLMSNEEVHWVGWSKHSDHMAVIILLSIPKSAFWFKHWSLLWGWVGPSITKVWQTFSSGSETYDTENQTLGYGDPTNAPPSTNPRAQLVSRFLFMSSHQCSYSFIHSRVSIVPTVCRALSWKLKQQNDSRDPCPHGAYSLVRKAILLKAH